MKGPITSIFLILNDYNYGKTIVIPLPLTLPVQVTPSPLLQVKFQP
jgi:hypothetical protein